MNEKWRDIPGFPGFQISAEGQVRCFWSSCTKNATRLHTPRSLRGYVSVQGYFVYTMRLADGSTRPIGLHRLLLTAFVRAPHDGEVGRHRNGKKTDNRLENLEWGTARDNVYLDEIRLGKRPANSETISAAIVEEVRRRHHQLARTLAKEFSISISSVYRFWSRKDKHGKSG